MIKCFSRESSMHLLLLGASAACTATVDGTGPAPAPTADTPPPPRASDGVETVEHLFDPPSFGKATPNDVIGLWSAGTSLDELRLLISADSIMLARRCATEATSSQRIIASATVAARVDRDSVAVLEAAEVAEDAPDGTMCQVTLVVQEIERCGYQTTDCFHMPGTGTQLTFFSTTTGMMGSLYGNWTKVMD